MANAGCEQVLATRSLTVESLRRKIDRLEGVARRAAGQPLSSGCPALDCLLPQKGFGRGSLIEWLAAGPGSGAEILAIAAAREACRQGGMLVVLDQTGEFYPPAAVRAGIELEQLIVVRTAAEGDYRWALDQALRCTAVAATLAWLEKIDGHTFRRLQLAVEEGGGLGLLLRPEHARHEPSWADVRLLVEPRKRSDFRFQISDIKFQISEFGRQLSAVSGNASRRVRITLLRCRGGADGSCVDVEIDDETHSLHPELAAAGIEHPRSGRLVPAV